VLLHKEHEYFMREALKEAKKAYEEDEVPIGSVIVLNDHIIARGYNQVERLSDATAHAEMISITSASNSLGSKYLKNCTIYITLEPCLMCAQALAWSQLSHIYFGANDDKQGFSICCPELYNNNIKLSSGLLGEECGILIKQFFKEKRDLQNLY